MKKRKTKICQRCTKTVPLRFSTCSSCGSNKFAPSFVKKLDKVNRQFSVQITTPIDSKDKRLTLYKWWPGGRSTFHINTQEQWEIVKDIVDNNLSRFLKWRSKKEIIKEIEALQKEEKNYTSRAKKLSKSHPKFIRTLLKNLDYGKIKEIDYQNLAEILNDLIETVSKADGGLILAFKNIIKKLPSQKKRAIEDLNDLLKTWSLKQITSISYQVINRLETLKLFKERVLDDRTYEIRGDDSIHRILENAMWIIDERYWLLHSNETLRKIIGKEFQKKRYKKYKNKRPDFVCGTVNKKLIIVELKRPSHILSVDDLNQLEDYLSIIEQYDKVNSFEAYLVGKRVSEDLKRKKRYRGGNFKILTFSQLISDTEQRYKEYIQEMKKKKK